MALIFLIGFRVALTLSRRRRDRRRLRGRDRRRSDHPPRRRSTARSRADNLHGDTYGPVNYLAYIPFELIWPWSGDWDTLPAAQAAAAAFDLACIGLSYLLGRRLRGPRFGLLLAYLWAAYPFTLLVLASGANDALLAALVLVVLLLARRGRSRAVRRSRSRG